MAHFGILTPRIHTRAVPSRDGSAPKIKNTNISSHLWFCVQVDCFGVSCWGLAMYCEHSLDIMELNGPQKVTCKTQQRFLSRNPDRNTQDNQLTLLWAVSCRNHFLRTWLLYRHTKQSVGSRQREIIPTQSSSMKLLTTGSVVYLEYSIHDF